MKENSTSLEIPEDSRSLTFHYHVHTNLSLIPVMWRKKSVQTLSSNFSKPHFNIILPSTPRSSKWILSCNFTHQDDALTFICYHAFHLTGPSYFPWVHTKTVKGIRLLKKTANIDLLKSILNQEVRRLLYFSTSNKDGWDWRNVSRIGKKRNLHWTFTGIPQGKRLLSRPKHKW